MTYLFDFDGTLVDSMPIYGATMLNLMKKYSLPVDENTLKVITPLGLKGTAEYFISLGLKAKIEDIVKDMADDMLNEYIHNIPAKEGVIDTLYKLKERGDRLAVLTASPHISLDPCLKRLGVFDLFEKVWSCDDFNTTKANPEIYKMVAKELNESVEDIIFVDDNANAVKTAKDAGMISYGIFDLSSKDFIEEMKSVSDKYLYTLSELL